jgi:hypothetical protein
VRTGRAFDGARPRRSRAQGRRRRRWWQHQRCREAASGGRNSERLTFNIVSQHSWISACATSSSISWFLISAIFGVSACEPSSEEPAAQRQTTTRTGQTLRPGRRRAAERGTGRRCCARARMRRCRRWAGGSGGTVRGATRAAAERWAAGPEARGGRRARTIAGPVGGFASDDRLRCSRPTTVFAPRRSNVSSGASFAPHGLAGHER